MPFERDPDDLGALWVKSSSRGEFMTGTINGVAVVCFRNDKATADNRQPSWRVLKSKPREAQPARVETTDDELGF